MARCLTDEVFQHNFLFVHLLQNKLIKVTVKSLSQLYSRFKTLQENGPAGTAAEVSDLGKTTCLNCGTEFQGRYCPSCGQSAGTRRLDIKGLFSGLFTALVGRDSTFTNTTIELLYRPGYLIRDYMAPKGRYTFYRNNPNRQLNFTCHTFIFT